MSEQDFDFEEFIKQNELTVIKQCFIDHNMNDIDTLNMNNPQFTKLMGDKTILSNAHLIQNIVTGIQSLEKLRNSKSNAEKKLIFTTQKENNTFTNIEDYIDNVKTFENELQTTINTNIKNRQQQNDKDIAKYTTQNSAKLSTIHTQINKTITKLHNILTQQEETFENKINDYRNNVKQIDLKHAQYSKTIDNILSQNVSMIDKYIKYFQNAIKQCRDIVHKYEEEIDNNSDKHSFRRSNTTHRENEIIKIGTMATDYYQKNMNILNDNKSKIAQYIENELILNMKQIYSLTINDNIYNNLCTRINELIKLSNNKIMEDDVKQEPQIKIIHISSPNNQQSLGTMYDDNTKKSPNSVVSEMTDQPPAAYDPNYHISPVPIPRIQSKPPPPPYNKGARVASKNDLQRQNKQQNVGEDLEESISIEMDEHIVHINGNVNHNLFFEFENGQKSHSPPAAFENYWECTVCTFAENPGSYLICKVCQSSRQLSEKKKHFRRQHSLSDPQNPPLMLPQSKSDHEDRARSDSNAAKVNVLKKAAKNNGNGLKKVERSQSVAVKKKKKSGLFGWNKNKKKSPKSKSKKKVQQ